MKVMYCKSAFDAERKINKLFSGGQRVYIKRTDENTIELRNVLLDFVNNDSQHCGETIREEVLQEIDRVIIILKSDITSRQAIADFWSTSTLKDKPACYVFAHFLVRNNSLSMYIYSRSCDYSKFFSKDYKKIMYLAHKVKKELGLINTYVHWHIGSLHVAEDGHI